MHTTPTNPSELTTLHHQIEIERLRLELTMIRVQTSALETLERFMEVQQSTGDEKKDKAEATKLNRQRLAANQALIHCRTAQRENRLATASRNTNPKPKKLEPNRTSDGSQATGKNMPPAPSPPRGRRWSCADSAQDRTRGLPEPPETSECGMLKQSLSMDPRNPEEHAQTSLSVPPKARSTNSRYKTRKPKHPRQSRKRKQRQR